MKFLLTNSFSCNLPYASAANNIYLCTFILSVRAIDIVRIQIKNGRALIEVATPVTWLEATRTEANGRIYENVIIEGCQVAWQVGNDDGQSS